MPIKDPEKRKEYHKKYNREIWYPANKDKHNNYVQACKKKQKEWFNALKRELKCSQCSESHPACLDFHHVNGDKEFNLATGRKVSMSKSRILAEMAKCIVLCSNCHRKLHYAERIGSGAPD